MALIKCPECGKKISDTAVNCPNCGYSLKKETTVKSNMARVGTILNIIGNALPLVVCLVIDMASKGGKFEKSLLYSLGLNGIIILISVLYLINLIKNKYLKLYGFGLLILNIIMIGIISEISFDCCSISVFIIGLFSSLLGTLFVLIESFKVKNV